MAELKDSGSRTEYESGAVRDVKEGKGRCDLMPLNAMAMLTHSGVIDNLYSYKCTGNITWLCEAIHAFHQADAVTDIYTVMIEVSKHFEDGARKYGENNWQKGIPVHSYIDSAIRHWLKWQRGDRDEPHQRAFVWNLMCAIWTVEHYPDLDDFTDNPPPVPKDPEYHKKVLNDEFGLKSSDETLENDKPFVTGWN